MSDLDKFRQQFSRVERLERELNLKQLQINRLLNITQAINNNVTSEGLFSMYNSFLSWELGVRKMALFIHGYDDMEDEWECISSIGIDDETLALDVSDVLPKYTKLDNLEASLHPLLSQFDLVIPVLHKDQPIAYVFIGGFGDDDDMFDKVQFITTITNIVAVAIENKRLFRQQIEQERMFREMELAGEMQRLLIPKNMPRGESYELSGVYKPHLGVGGDYYDYVVFPDGEIVFCIGDISGKGLAAALLMANFQANFHSLIHKRAPLDAFIRELNLSIHRITEGERFITFFVARYDIHTSKLRYVNAGHNPPVLVSGGKAEYLKKGCTILGSFESLPSLEVGEVLIEDEAVILTYTDGLTDVRNSLGEYFEEEKLLAFVQEHYQKSAALLNDHLVETVELFKEDEKYPDDFTVLTCKLFRLK